MPQAKTYLSLTGWILTILSTLSLLMSVGLLASSWITFEWRLSMFEAVGGAFALLSLLGLICGVGVLRRRKIARVPSMIWFGIGAAFWVLSTANTLFASIGSPSEVLAELREAPFASSATILLEFVMAVWCMHTIYMFSRSEVKNAFDA